MNFGNGKELKGYWKDGIFINGILYHNNILIKKINKNI